MADENPFLDSGRPVAGSAAAGVNVPDPVLRPANDDSGGDNPFLALGRPGNPEVSGVGSFAHSAERSAIPAGGMLAGAGAGAEAGCAIGSLPGPGGALVGGIVGGIAGGLGGGYTAERGQDWALKAAPDDWKEAIGQDDRQQRLDQEQHPYASFLGGLAPFALTMRPDLSWGAVAKLPENATSFQRVMANPVTARVFGGLAMGGMEIGQEA